MGKAYQCDLCKCLFSGETQNYLHIGRDYTKREYCATCWQVILMRMEGPPSISI